MSNVTIPVFIFLAICVCLQMHIGPEFAVETMPLYRVYENRRSSSASRVEQCFDVQD